MKKILTALMAASMLMPTVALASGPRRPKPVLVTSYGVNAWCGPDTFEEKCKIRIGDEGLTGTGTDITTINQWTYSGQPYNMAEGVAGAVVGGAAIGMGSIATCAAVAGPAAMGCIALFPFMPLLGAGVGSRAGGSGITYFKVVGEDADGNEIEQQFKTTIGRSGHVLRKLRKKLKKFTGLPAGEIRTSI
tara:strand:- start:257 stop:826 length:570 start_codon:yes stop_codon:yes gene_type:complete